MHTQVFQVNGGEEGDVMGWGGEILLGRRNSMDSVWASFVACRLRGCSSRLSSGRRGILFLLFITRGLEHSRAS